MNLVLIIAMWLFVIVGHCFSIYYTAYDDASESASNAGIACYVIGITLGIIGVVLSFI